MQHVMKVLQIVMVALLLGTGAAQAADVNCRGAAGGTEEFRYAWRLRGGLGWIAGLLFPRSGVGNLKTTYPKSGEHAINSSLLITSSQGTSGGFYAYESQMDEGGQNTLMTYHGYAWGSKSRKERTIFDYVKRLARIRKETPEKIEDKVKPLPPDQLRDVLTAIYYLRQHADQIRQPMQTSIYSDGKEYPVIFRPIESKPFTIEGEHLIALGFEIVDAPGGKKWPGGVRLYISSDARRVPLRIEIQQSMASMQLDLKSIEACAVVQAAK